MSFAKFPIRCPRAVLAALLSTAALPAQADFAASAAPRTALDSPEIIVIGPQLFRDVRPERDLDEAAISGYGIGTVDELVAEIQGELGEQDEPVFVVNGQRVFDLDEIGAFPVEVLRQVQVLPRGSATRVGGSPGQRVVSLTLHRKVRSATVTVAPRLATEGDWNSVRGEAILTSINGPTRANLALRVRDDSALLESERDIVQLAPRLPYAARGNVIAYPDLSGEIDPLLTDAAGTEVVVAPIPSGTTPSLSDFAAAANVPAVTDLGEFRTLSPKARSYELSASYNRPLASWLSASATVRLARSDSESRLGLAQGLFELGPDNPFSPFSTSVGLAALRGGDPLRYRSRRDSGAAALTLNATIGRWQASLNARHSEVDEDSSTERSGNAPITIADDVNPFAVDLGALIAVTRDKAALRSHSNSGQLTLIGPALKLPAGDLLATLEARVGTSALDSTSSFSGTEASRHIRRSEQSVRGAIEVPIASRRNQFLGAIGELGATAEYSRVHFSDAGLLQFHSFGLTWEPVPTLRFRGAIEKLQEPASIELLGGPVVVTPLARTFDVLRGETVDVELISGGNPFLLPQTTRTRRLSGLWRLAPSLGLQVNAEYSDIATRNFVSSLPPASSAVVLAFPDRFVRDSDGDLVSVDLRPVNFAGHRQKLLRYGFSLNTPIGGGNAIATPGRPVRPQTRLQLTANHNIVFTDTIRIRDGLDPVDLLGGGAIGIGGGRTRHQVDATASVTSGGLGFRLGANWRGGNALESRIDGTDSRLHFSPLLIINAKAFADADRLLPKTRWTSGLRFSVNVFNLTGQRQHVTDDAGDTPLQYQPAYRDPIGRSIELEVRKVF